ncbi:MAG: sulfur reduction protein DsrE [Flavobacteriaceae bacterium]|uniref:DsrE family protein n=1 Tax=Winogradskyella sp. SYSU M77433 TaxID=3042722 RepID=UPI000C45A7ED|nr:DsrE family protein [Winogradskyella sp. SYSU M77433]MAX69762.1 sulfur reduction protein DsrE [Flavobacteriaceae bacterium]MDH7914484.1 DsrE family protein [Winogradskyella sp. SYSU M77433]
MKKLFLITSLFLMVLGTVEAQEFSSEKHNYVVLSKNIKQLNPVLLTATALADEDGANFGEFFVIICGKTVQNIPNNEDLKHLLQKTKAQNIRVFVCGISLKKFNIDPNKIPNTMELTENGILYGFQLAKQGFITLTI